jgi:peptidoglycan L-alanyl-D-glutamate endopeptidase CwlK
MSAGQTTDSVVVCNDITGLAPKFGAAVVAAIKECNAKGFDAIVFESFRSDITQKVYYARGRTVIPPQQTVTNASDNSYSWHGYDLAVDVISKSKEWDAPYAWFKSVAEIFKANGCKWGGDWKRPDMPHMQWGKCKPSPSSNARQLLAQGQLQTIWKLVNAI